MLPPSRLPIFQPLFTLVVIVFLVATLSSSGATSTSVGATGNDPRAFPKTFHIWGGNPSNYAHYDVVIGYPAWDLASLRTANAGAIYLADPMLDPFNSDWTQRKGLGVTNGAEDVFSGVTDTVVDGSAANLGTIAGWNGYWDTLHHPDGSIALINSSYGHPGWNLTRTDTAEKVAKIEAYGAKLSKIYRNGWDGIWSDNWIYRIGASWFYGSNLDTNRDGQADDMNLVSRQWWDGLSLVGQRLRSYLPGKIVGGNGAHNISGLVGGTDPNAPYKASNVTMNEVLQFYTGKPDMIVSEVQSYLGFSDPLGMPRYFLLMHQLPGGQSDYRSMRWGFSLATIAGAYYEPYASSHDDAFKYDEFTGGSTAGKRGWLGAPTTAPTKLTSGVWRRDFANGVVLNNSTTSAQTVSLGATYQRLKGSQDSGVNSGASVTSVTVPAGDGLFLLGSGGASGLAPQNTTPPTISGNALVGQTLSVSNGTWSGSPTAYLYQWQRCDSTGATCSSVAGANAAAYSLTELDTGSTMRAKVTASNSSGATSATSASTDVVADMSFAATQTIAQGSTLSGTIAWSADASGKTVSSIAFAVDGDLIATDTSAPYSTSIDTTKLVNGTHTFAVEAIAADGTIATANVTADVSNQVTSFTVGQNLSDGQTLSGSVGWSASASGKTVSRVDFAVDGSVVASDGTSPFGTTLDTTRLADGSHSFTVKGFATDASTASATASAKVSNGAGSVTPPTSFTVSDNVTSGQTVSGILDWVADPSGKPVKRVDFVVDGAKVGTEATAPYRISYDTRKLATGTHTFAVRAFADDGATASDSSNATVSNQGDAFSVAQNISTGQTLTGKAGWSATVSGKDVRRVEFTVDTSKVSTEAKAPYETSYDTRKLSDGSHTFAVTAVAGDGTTATAKAVVTVSNQATASAGAGSTTSTTPTTSSTSTTSTTSTAPAALTLESSIKDGSTITGSVKWTITATGKALSKVEFYIDDKRSWVEHKEPWQYGGDRRLLDTSTLTHGSHVFKVKAYAKDGTVVVLTLAVTVE